MATLIEVRNAGGLVGRCDANCYNAHADQCTCVCGGRNHGAGLAKAMENAAGLAEKMVAEFAKARGVKDFHARRFGREIEQGALPLVWARRQQPA